MRKILLLALAMATVVLSTACGSVSEQSSEASTTSSQVSQAEITTTPTTEQVTTTAAVSLEDLKVGDEVNITGQVATTTLVDDNTLWVQVQSDDGSYTRYDCQLKSEFIEEFDLLQVVKVKGYFVSLMDLKQENTMPIVTLSDCEIEG